MVRLAPARGHDLPGPDLTFARSAVLFVGFVALWSTYFTISEMQSCLHDDVVEAYVWGQEFQLGYNQHPPFWAWICGAWFMVFPRADWAFAILSTLNAAIGLAGSWMLIGRFARGDKRIAATALLLLTPFYTFLSHKYNANSIFLSIWPWTMFFFVRAIDEDGGVDAMMFGLLMGCALLSKYYAGILGLTCGLAALQHPARARYFRSASPYLSIVVAAIVFAPHAWWLMSSGAPPLRYLQRISGLGYGEVLSLSGSAIVGVFALNAVALALVAATAYGTPRSTAFRLASGDARFRILATLVLAPMILSVLAAIALRTKLSSPMLMGAFSLAPLLAIEIARERGLERLRLLSTRLAATLTLGAFAASPIVSIGKAWHSNLSEDKDPRRELAIAATDFWRQTTKKPLEYVGGSWRYDNAVVFYSAERPHGFIRFSYFGNQWVTPRKLAENGLLSVCLKDDVECAASTAKFATNKAARMEIKLTHQFAGHESQPVSFVLTAIPPGVEARAAVDKKFAADEAATRPSRRSPSSAYP